MFFKNDATEREGGEEGKKVTSSKSNGHISVSLSCLGNAHDHGQGKHKKAANRKECPAPQVLREAQQVLIGALSAKGARLFLTEEGAVRAVVSYCC